MSEIPSLCVMGGETVVRKEEWKLVGKEKVWINSRSDAIKAQKGMYVRPASCPLNKACTGKVKYTNGVENGFSQAIIQDLIVVNRGVVRDFDLLLED